MFADRSTFEPDFPQYKWVDGSRTHRELQFYCTQVFRCRTWVYCWPVCGSVECQTRGIAVCPADARASRPLALSARTHLQLWWGRRCTAASRLDSTHLVSSTAGPPIRPLFLDTFKDLWRRLLSAPSGQSELSDWVRSSANESNHLFNRARVLLANCRLLYYSVHV